MLRNRVYKFLLFLLPVFFREQDSILQLIYRTTSSAAYVPSSPDKIYCLRFVYALCS